MSGISLPIAEVREPRPRIRKHRVMAGVVAAYALAAAGAAVLGDRLPVPTWLALHLLLLGAATNAVFVWSRHFAQALLHAKLGSERAAHVRLGVLNVGILSVLIGIPLEVPAEVALGAALVVGAVVAHGLSLVAMARRSKLAGKLRGCVHYYVASAAFLAVGATLGALLGTGAVHSSALHLAHAHANVLGWLGLAVLGTQFMLWPAVLRTRMAEDAPRVARTVLPLTALGLANAVLALVLFPGTTGHRVAAVGMAVYLGGVLLSLRPFLEAARRRRPHNAASAMLAAGTSWLAVALTIDVLALARSPQEAAAAMDLLVPLLALGLVAQVLVGALTFLLPVTIGGGPHGNRRIAAILETGWVARLVLTNVGVLIVALTEAGTDLRRAGLALTLVSLASAAPLVVVAVNASRTPAMESPQRASRDWTEHVAIGSILTVVAALALVAAPANAVLPPTDADRVVDVTLTEFAVSPATLTVAPGTRVVLRVRNAGDAAHDLRFPGGRATPKLAPGRSADLDLGVVTEQQDGWCTLAGHRAAGMTMTVAVGEPSEDPGHGHGATSTAPAPDWQPYDPRLEPASGGREHRVTLEVEETEVEVANGVRQKMWTFGGTVPGPALRGKVGDTFVITLVNRGTIEHSIDFHASQVAPDRLMKPIPPGGSIVYSFRAERAGAWLYHCSTAPMLQHVAMGMYGALVIDPPDLVPVDHELLLVQSEVWKGDPSLARLTAAEEDLVVFNGYADQYVHAPVQVATGDRVRIWVVTAGPSESSAFHVVGTQFDTVYEEGRYGLRPGDPGGAQVLDIPPGAGGFAELVIPEDGTYPMVTHRLADAARGATGLLVAGRD